MGCPLDEAVCSLIESHDLSQTRAIVWTTDGTIFGVSQAVTSFFGWDAEAIPTKIEQLFPNFSYQPGVDSLSREQIEGAIAEVRYCWKRMASETVAIGTFDLVERRQKQVIGSLEELFHDLANARQVEAGMLMRLQSPHSVGDQREAIASLCAAHSETNLLIEEMEGVVEHGEQVSGGTAHFSLFRLFNLLRLSHERKLSERSLTFIFPGREELPSLLNLDYTRFRRILVNLLGNAIKFSPEGSTIRLNMEFEEERRLLLHLSNPGDLSDDDCEMIFRSRSTSDPLRGRGLGLSFCRRFAEELGGELQVLSMAGEVRFTLSLPLHPVLVAERPPCDPLNPLNGVPSLSAHEGMRLLVADDERICRLVSVKVLSKLKIEGRDLYQVSSVDSGLKLIEGIREAYERGTPYHVAFVDNEMAGGKESTGLNGGEAAKLIRGMEEEMGVPTPQRTALVLFSGNPDSSLVKQCEMDGLVAKPAHIDSMMAIIERVGVPRLKAEKRLRDSDSSGSI